MSHLSVSLKTLAVLLSLICFLTSWNQAVASGTTYYVSTTGSDSNNGTSATTPWKTFAKVNAATLKPGDQVLFNRGDTFTNTALILNYSGVAGSPITFGAYGTGANPVLDGGGSAKAILSISNQVYITINNLVFQNNTSQNGGVFLYRDHDITIRNNFFTKVATGVYAATCTNNIVFDANYALNMMGPFPRGQMIQLDGVSGSGVAITNNKVQEIMGQSNPEDEINIYQSNGTAGSPIMISGNQIEGGGPSITGGGIMLGDGGGSYEVASNNILVNPGQYGMAVASGTNMTISNNQIYAAKNTFTNVGIYAWNQSASTCSAVTISNNQINWTSSSGAASPKWDGGNCGTIAGWSTNVTNSSLSLSLLPNPLWTALVLSVPVDTGTTTPSADTTAPTVSLISPIAKATISGTSTLTATASDNMGVTKVGFYYNNVLIGTATGVPYSFNWNTVPYNDGIYLLHATASDAAGNTTTSTSVPVTISNTAVVVTPPVVTPPVTIPPSPSISSYTPPVSTSTPTAPEIPAVPTIVYGCSPGYLFSTMTGVSCTGSTSAPTAPINPASFTINMNATITSPYNFGLLTLRNGTHNNYVKELQRFLNVTLNLGLVIDGKFGPKTEAVVKTWQTNHGLVSDGLVGYKTKGVMNGTVMSHS